MPRIHGALSSPSNGTSTEKAATDRDGLLKASSIRIEEDVSLIDSIRLVEVILNDLSLDPVQLLLQTDFQAAGIKSPRKMIKKIARQIQDFILSTTGREGPCADAGAAARCPRVSSAIAPADM